MKDSAIRIGISFVCTALIVIHHVWPKLTVDLPTLILVALALLPWLASVFKSIELPGGVKIELHDIKAATDKIQSPGIMTSVNPETAPLGSQTVAAAEPEKPPSTARPDDDFGSLATIGSADPNLALVGIRIEIERRLAKLAEHAGVRRRSAGAMC